MKFKSMKIIAIVLAQILLTLFFVQLAAADIELHSPGDNYVGDAGEIGFQFSFNQAPSLKNCSLLIDNVTAKTYGNPQTSDVVFKVPVAAGEHQWTVRCYGTDGTIYEADQYTITLEAIEATGKSEVVITGDGLGSSGLRYSFNWYQQPSQMPVLLEEILVNDIITIINPHLEYLGKRAKEREFDIEILELRTWGERAILGYADENDRATKELEEGRAVNIDVDFDGQLDTQMKFKQVKGRNAVIEFTYMGAKATADNTAEDQEEKDEPEEDSNQIQEQTQEDSEIISEQQQDTQAELDDAPYEAEQTTQEDETAYEEEGNALGVILFIVVVVIIIVGIVMMSQGMSINKSHHKQTGRSVSVRKKK
ncbi:hypothetical protein JW868_00230 [Candidatus Woesearchaeota archaeon]|nr:hypothetical protein [Candidatus Woesearchaeota archaeon]